MPSAVEVFHMTDEVWGRLCLSLPLPSDMRGRLDFLIEASRKNASDIEAHGKPSETRERIERILDKTKGLLDEFKPLPPDVSVAMVRGDRLVSGEMQRPAYVIGSPFGEIDKLHTILDNIVALEKWLETAASRISEQKGTPGRKSDPILFLVSQIDILLAQIGLPKASQSINRGSSLPLIQDVVRIAHPQAGNGTIIEAIKQVVKSRKATPPPGQSDIASGSAS